ncbi:KN motif and ankyrin repeat domain-containing protein 1-like [Notechis scutatus]|uniref:KN motif and ankyrin repeat domain-containing protein 1-like n=1 Tax=Notechis scutatus TaxID=8663 RepID=A0A6J1VU25_9SAUR|nr:KN motif and ankyrin repeat domain-containing protein 1-like [Notechis scutatus]
MPYSVETPYGFLLDLDFLKYVDDIERGQTLRKLPLPRKGKGSKPAQSFPRSQMGGWASTESLSSSASEDGKLAFSPRPRTASYGTKEHAGKDGCSFPTSPPPASRLLPPASPNSVGRGSRVETTLLETSRRLEEAQLVTGEGPAAPKRTGGPSKNSTCPPNSASSPSGEGQAEPVKTSPPNSGRSTPVPAASPAHLHHVREQMAAALKQLKELEEQVKMIPLLEEQICRLKQEKEQLVAAGLGEKGEAEAEESGVFCFPPRQGLKDGPACPDPGGPQPEREGEATKGRTSKIAELKKLTERLTGPERAGKSRGAGRPSRVEQPGQRSIGVGEEADMSEVVCYYRSQRPCREVAVGCERETCDAEVWVMESFLGVSSAAEEEMQLVQQRVQHQQAIITMLEGHLKEATQELEELRVEVCSRRPGSLVSQATSACPEMAEACVEAVTPTRCQAVGSHVETVEAGVQSFLQTSHVGVGCNLQGELNGEAKATEEDSPRKASPIPLGTEHGGHKGHLRSTVATPDAGTAEEGSGSEDARQSTSGKEGTAQDEPDTGRALPLGMGGKGSREPNGAEGASGTGALKSIMKRLDSPAKAEPGVSGKKTLQFVGLLNGEYESTSSEEDSFNETVGGLEGDAAASPDVSDSSEEEEEEEGSPGTEEAPPGHPQLSPDPEDAAGQGGATPKVKERFELSPWMREACLVVRAHLGHGRGAPKSKELGAPERKHLLRGGTGEGRALTSAPLGAQLSSSSLVLREWFRVSSQKSSRASKVAKYLQALDELSPALLAHVLNLSDGNGNMALHYSVSHSNFDIVRLLLDTGVCNVNHQNKAGYTALMLAALATMERQDDMAVVRRLFDLGNVNAKASQAGQTALMLAVSHGRQEMVQALLACGADANLQDEEGSTALMCACEHGRAETVRLLLAQPACDTSIADHDGNDAVAIALEAGHDNLAALISAHLTQSADRTGA